MEDDEFGDLYTDVLKPLTAQPPPIQSTATTTTSSGRPIDLNINSDDEEILYGAPTNSNQSNFKISFQSQKASVDAPGSSDLPRNSSRGLEDEDYLAGKLWEDKSGSKARVLGSNAMGKVPENGFEDPNFMDESGIDIVVEERDDKDGFLENFEGNTGTEGMGREPMIPGLSMPRVLNQDGGGGGEGEGGDWDSDSDDDLQIVLNENTGIMGMERAGAGEDEDEDEDGDPLVIVAGNDPIRQQLEERDWGEDAAQAAEGGEKTEMGDSAAKVNGGAIAAPKFGYSSHGYQHPFHSQFKYVRPVAAPPGAAPVAPGGVPAQVRPPLGMTPFTGRGRGDWRPTGIRGPAPMQKNFHPGYGAPAWGNGGAGRGFGSGLDFTLPSHKTIFEVDIDGFEEKPWRLQGIDISDFFNFGLNEESWKEYCKQLDQLRLEATMQSKIRVYESGRAEQEYDPDLPPELAAAAGIHDVSAEIPNLGKVDPGQGDLAKESVRSRPQWPPGRAIQVETGYGERLPSIDSRPQRMREPDSVIEIVLQDSGDDDSYAGNDVAEQPENALSKEVVPRGVHEIEGAMPEEADRFDGEPVQDLPGFRGKTGAYSGREYNVPNDKRRTKRRPDRSPSLTHSGRTQDNKFINNQKDESVESVERKQSPLSSPVTGGSAEERELNKNDARHDEIVAADESSEGEGGQALDKSPANKIKTDNPMHSMKKQKLSPLVEPPSVQEIDEGGDCKAARRADNSRARSESSRGHRNTRDSVDEEVLQAGRSRDMGMDKRLTNEDAHNVRGRGRNERLDMDRHHAPMKGREDSYSRKHWDPTNMAQHSQTRGESLDRRKGGDPDGVWQRDDEYMHDGRTRADDTRKRERGDEMVSRHRSKVRGNERSDKDESHSRKALENGNWKGYHDTDLVPRHKDRDDRLMIRNDNLDDLHSKRRKEDVHLRRDHAGKEEFFYVPKESTNLRKREREDVLDQRKRVDLARLREDDQLIVRHNKEEVWLQRERAERERERDEWLRLKQSQEENIINREREEGRGGLRSGRLVEDKAWARHSRVKEEYKGGDRKHQMQDTGRHSEQINRRDKVDRESHPRHRGRDDAYVHGNQLDNDERRSRQERGNTATERSVSISDTHKPQEKKHKENPRKSKESEVGDRTSLASRRNREDHGGQRSERVRGRSLVEQGSGEHDNAANRQTTRKHKEDVSSDDEQQDSRKGRTKFERWTSHTERDFGIGINPSAFANVKEIDRYNNNATEEMVENSQSQVENIDVGPTEFKNDDDTKPSDEDKRLDTVDKLKKRSERFKLPLPSEKESVAVKKIENEPLPPVLPETRADLEIKPERPARKRRWTGS